MSIIITLHSTKQLSVSCLLKTLLFLKHYDLILEQRKRSKIVIWIINWFSTMKVLSGDIDLLKIPGKVTVKENIKCLEVKILGFQVEKSNK